jgi:hypothetical protein
MLFAVRPRHLTPLLMTLLGAIPLVAPALAGPPFRTDDPEPVEFQHFEINLFSQGIQTNDGWRGFLPGFEVNYGTLPNLQVHAIFQQGFTAPSGGRTGFALGDTELGVKYRFHHTGRGRLVSTSRCISAN